jgi:hypothetical protein
MPSARDRYVWQMYARLFPVLGAPRTSTHRLQDAARERATNPSGKGRSHAPILNHVRSPHVWPTCRDRRITGFRPSSMTIQANTGIGCKRPRIVRPNTSRRTGSTRAEPISNGLIPKQQPARSPPFHGVTAEPRVRGGDGAPLGTAAPYPLTQHHILIRHLANPWPPSERRPFASVACSRQPSMLRQSPSPKGRDGNTL